MASWLAESTELLLDVLEYESSLCKAKIIMLYAMRAVELAATATAADGSSVYSSPLSIIQALDNRLDAQFEDATADQEDPDTADMEDYIAAWAKLKMLAAKGDIEGIRKRAASKRHGASVPLSRYIPPQAPIVLTADVSTGKHAHESYHTDGMTTHLLWPSRIATGNLTQHFQARAAQVVSGWEMSTT